MFIWQNVLAMYELNLKGRLLKVNLHYVSSYFSVFCTVL